MQDLIDRNALVEELKQTKFPCMLPSGIDYLEGIQTAVTRITALINDAVQVEAEQVRHGRWIETKYNPVGDTMYCDCNCSNCNFEITREKGRYPKFCENCGARMDLRTPTEVQLDEADSVMMGGADNAGRK